MSNIEVKKWAKFSLPDETPLQMWSFSLWRLNVRIYTNKLYNHFVISNGDLFFAHLQRLTS